MKNHNNPKITWKTMCLIEDIVPQRSRYGVYCKVYTNTEACITATESEAQKLCLFEPYILSGIVKIRPGGIYLALKEARLFNGKEFREEHFQ